MRLLAIIAICGQKREYELNVSGVLRKISGKWYFQSLHYSNVTGGGGN